MIERLKQFIKRDTRYPSWFPREPYRDIPTKTPYRDSIKDEYPEGEGTEIELFTPETHKYQTERDEGEEWC